MSDVTFTGIQPFNASIAQLTSIPTKHVHVSALIDCSAYCELLIRFVASLAKAAGSLARFPFPSLSDRRYSACLVHMYISVPAPPTLMSSVTVFSSWLSVACQ